MRHTSWAWAMVVLGTLAAMSWGQGNDKLLLADFEQNAGMFELGQASIAPSPALGSKAAELMNDKGITATNPKVNWGQYNFFRLEAFNPAEQPGRLQVTFVDDSAPHGYYSWINRYISVRPGKSTIELYLPELKRGESSPKDSTDPRPFHWDKVQRLTLTSGGGYLQVDNIRVEKVNFERQEGVQAFDFGPVGSPVSPLCVGVTPDSAYSDQAGFGWSKPGSLRAMRRSRSPDTFVGDWIAGQDSVFSVKLPDGRYQVWMLWEDPGEWELYQNYQQRSIEVNGQAVIKETMNGEEFLDRYFHFAETEDLPGDDIYARYLGWRYQPRQFEVQVGGGRLDLTIRSDNGNGATVNGLVIYPQAKAEAGKQFIERLQAWRKHEFDNAWSEQLPRKSAIDRKLAQAGRGRGFILFSRGLKDVTLWDAPKAEEVLGESEIKLTAARGQAEPLVFSLHALADLPEAKVTVGELRGEGGSLPASAVRLEMVRYKFKNIGFSGAGVYGSVPWLLVDAKPVAVQKDSNRTWCLSLQPPKDQAAGVYRGKLSIEAGGKTLSLPLSLRVLPVELPEADMGLSMFAIWATAPWFAYYPENQERQQQDLERSLAFARQIGFTHIQVEGIAFNGFKDGKAQVDMTKAKANYEQARRQGFTFVDVLEGGQGFFAQAIRDKGALAKQHGFASSDDLVKETFGAAIAAAKAVDLPSPLFSLGDEPPETVAGEFVQMHQRMKELAGARSFICWSPHGENTTKLLNVTSVCSLNVATAEHFARAKAAGNELYLNNQGWGRWNYGLYMWKAHQAGVRAYQQFTWLGTHGDPYYPLDSNEDDGGALYPDRQGKVRPVFHLLSVRQGIDDYRYVLALKQAIDKALAGSEEQKKLATEAKVFMASVVGNLKFEDTARDRHPQLSDVQLAEFRAQVQEWLGKLGQ